LLIDRIYSPSPVVYRSFLHEEMINRGPLCGAEMSTEAGAIDRKGGGSSFLL
jgi:hypothetical protein